MRIPVENSSAIVSAGYDPDTQTVEVEYKGGRIYQAKDVPADVWAPVEKSFTDPTVSTGKLFNEQIKGNYELRPV